MSLFFCVEFDNFLFLLPQPDKVTAIQYSYTLNTIQQLNIKGCQGSCIIISSSLLLYHPWIYTIYVYICKTQCFVSNWRPMFGLYTRRPIVSFSNRRPCYAMIVWETCWGSSVSIIYNQNLHLLYVTNKIY